MRSAFCLVIIAACAFATCAFATCPALAKADRANGETALPGQMRAVWSGLGVQLARSGETSSWPIRVITDKSGGLRTEYPSLGCAGIMEKMPHSNAWRERIMEGDCVDGGTITMLQRSDSLAWYWTGEGSDSPNLAAVAVLYLDNEALTDSETK